MIHELKNHVSDKQHGNIVWATENDLQDWGRIFNWFKAGAYDSCKTALAHYNYTLIQLRDGIAGTTYDVIKEK